MLSVATLADLVRSGRRDVRLTMTLQAAERAALVALEVAIDVLPVAAPD